MRFLYLLVAILSLPLQAKIQLLTRIHDIDYGKVSGDQVLVFLESGHVAKLDRSRKISFSMIESAKDSKRWFKIILNDDRTVESLKFAEPSLKKEETGVVAKSLQEYILTTIESNSKAKQYFRESPRPTKEETQCFNRAIVWSYEWWKNHSVKSGKMFIFFGRDYIRRYNFEWWFHVAPYVHVMDNGRVGERMMDVKYAGGPLEIRKWSNLFMKNDAECPVITKYTEYADNPYSGDCFLQRSHMYTYQPADLQMYEAWGYSKDAFNMNEVKGAYLEAFTAPPVEEEETEETETGTTTGGTF